MVMVLPSSSSREAVSLIGFTREAIGRMYPQQIFFARRRMHPMR